VSGGPSATVCAVAKVAVVHVPFYSHIEAATRLSGVLARQGHDVTAWGPGPYRKRIESSGARFELHEPEMPRVIGFPAYVAALAGITEQWSAELIEQFFVQDVDLVVHDSQVPWARVAGDYLGLPRIVSHPMFPIISPGRIPTAADAALPETEPEQARAIFEAHWLSIGRRWGVELGEWDSVIHSAGASDTTVAFTTEEIVGDFDLPASWHCIGPLMAEPPPRAPANDRPVVYVCLGTSFNGRAEVFKAVIEGLAAEPIEVIVSTGDGSVSATDLGPLPANVDVRQFVAGREVLARASVHVTHGGNNSVHESLLAGVPMLFLPQAYDQFPLAHRIQELGAGLVVEESPAAIRAGVRWLLEDEEARSRADELGQHLARYDGEHRVAALIERVLAGSGALVT
jgi:MGT family glycosyltransferase